MINKLPGVDIKLARDRRVCLYSVAEELFLLVGNLLCLNKYCVLLAGDSLMLEQLPGPLKTEVSVFSLRIRALDRIYAERLNTLRVVDQPGSNVVSLKRGESVKVAPYPLSLVQRRQKTFDTREEIYVFVLGMCGLALHPSGEAHTVDLDAVYKPIQDWWRQVVVAQELCSRLLTQVSTSGGLLPANWLEGLEGLNRELVRAVWRYRSKRG